ncbi:MAG: TIGR04222 domain-containing membrane protein [Rhodoferax sp.]|nr:TIGR04222 domain-containing membrane protein [Rhodoferax sp.]
MKTDIETDLYKQIHGFNLSDPSAVVTFESKLAADNAWTLGYAYLVTAEYRRYLYLTQVAGHMVCPSQDVDLAWHLHLTQTRSYQLLCQQVFGKFLHHTESGGGPAEFEKHKAMYSKTLDAYCSVYGELPAPAIWPDITNRFSAPAGASQDAAWKVPNALGQDLSSAVVVAILAAILGWAWNQIGEPTSLQKTEGTGFLIFYLSSLVAITLVHVLAHRRRKSHVTQVPVLDPYEVAWLVGGGERVIGTALATLVGCGALQLQAQRKADKITGADCERTPVNVDTSRLHPIERTCLEFIPQGKLQVDQLRVRVASCIGSVRHRVESARLQIRVGEMPRANAITALLLTCMLVVGFSRLFYGVAAGHFVGFLWVALLVNFFMICRKLVPTGQLTASAEKAVDDLRQRHAKLKDGLASEATSGGLPAPTIGALTLAFALFGTQAVMASDDFAGINFLFGDNSTNNTGNSGSTAGCAGGGGGCGGCGGCGG